MNTTDWLFRVSILGALGLSACVGRSGVEPDETETGASSTETGEPEPVDPLLCEDPQPILQAGTDVPSGFVTCADGFIHRVEAVACVQPQQADTCVMGVPEYGCQTDADCTDRPFGSCHEDFDELGCQCSYGCETDADCLAGQLCACAGVVDGTSQCIPAGCLSSDGCEAGLCGLELWEDNLCGYDYGVTACTHDAIECKFQEDCGDLVCDGGQVLPLRCQASSGWTCQLPESIDYECGGYCGEGRPFLVDDELLLAATCERTDWCGAGTSTASPQAPELAAHWARVGQFEHASVASFARFAVQLQALGAPPQLLLETQRAALDEVVHAQLAFGLASRFAGRSIGPGPLPIAGALAPAITPRAIVRGLILEACVGETLAAIEARRAAELARDPEVRLVLERIAADEQRHATLGWATLRWLLETGDAELRRFALRCFDEALRAASSVDVDDGPEDLAHGRLGASRRASIRASAIAKILRPCVGALSSSPLIA